MTGTRRSTMTAVSLTAIVVVNLLVLAKYAPRVGVPWMILAAGYLGVVTAGVYGSRRRPGSMTALRPLLFWTTVVLAALLYLLILDRVPPGSVRVDRWSAITAFNEKLLAGEYPYEARTHLGSRVSGLPMLFAFGLPFQWAGDVGYLQVFAFVVFAVACQRLWGQRFDVVPPLLLLVTSPANLWEVAARSDLLSNSLVLVMFLFLSEQWRGKKTRTRMAALGVLGGLVASTRLVLAVPMLVYFIGYFRRDEVRAAVTSAAVALAVFAATILPFVLWDPRLFLSNNPFVWQTILAPIPVQAGAVVASVAAGLAAGSLSSKCFSAGLVLFATVLVTFLLGAWNQGLEKTLVGSGFDISYFDLALPLLLVPLLFSCPAAVHILEGGDRPGPSPAETGR